MAESREHTHTDGCAHCGGGYPLFLHGRCHPRSSTWTVALSAMEFEVRCTECGKPICRIVGELKLVPAEVAS